MNKAAKEIAITERIRLREASLDDAEFILELLNEPGWLTYISSQHGVSSLDKARDYISERLLDAYETHGYGLWLIEQKSDNTMLGMCGLVRRDSLPGPDLGFALLERYSGQGYAYEASEAAIQYAKDNSLSHTLLAITLPENTSSIRLLERLGFSFDSDLIYEETEERLLKYALAINSED